MAKLTRYLQQIFGSTANAGRISKFGSLAAGSPTTYSGATVTPANVQALSNYLQGWDGANIGNNSPAVQDMNALQWLFSRQLAYLFQEGIAEYDASTTYYTGSLCNYSGVIVQSLIDSNTGNTPSTTAATADWTPIFLTRPNLPSVGQQISSSSSTFASTSASFVAVTNLSVSITTTGRPVMVFLQQDGTANSANFGMNNNAQNSLQGAIQVLRGATVISQSIVFNQSSTATSRESGVSMPPGCVSCLDTPTAGTYTYSVKAQSDGAAVFSVQHCVLVAFEL